MDIGQRDVYKRQHHDSLLADALIQQGASHWAFVADPALAWAGFGRANDRVFFFHLCALLAHHHRAADQHDAGRGGIVADDLDVYKRQASGCATGALING